MKLTIKRLEFLSLLTYAIKAIPVKSADALFLNFLITVKEDKVSVIGSDGNNSVKVDQFKKDNKGEEVILSYEEGSIQTPAKFLLDIVSKMGGNIITLNMVDTNYLNISDEYTDFNLITRDGEEYPAVDFSVSSENNGFKAKLSDLKVLFDTTSFAVATRGSKELYYGINIRANDGKLAFMATDSFRMAKLTIPEENQKADFSFTCPVNALSMVTSIAEDSDCTIFFDDVKALFVTDKVTISSRLYRGDFPSTDRFNLNNFPYEVYMDTNEFLSAASRVKIILASEDKNSQVKLTVTKDGAVLSAKSTNYGNSQENIRNTVVTMPENSNIFEIGFNVDFVVEAVKALKSEKFHFAFAEPTRMFMVKNDDENNIQIITPIRMASM